ncbi:MAG: DUF362 domain-containing protein [Bacteroidales bacterium]|nr:DUF362 domain-containing protein [Bacteroidales bacterium]MCF8388652.1 DUF362 domain-containing protein [Bacteroidales bacterium]MCF8397477.1 DUF362 domain-containing protein [Bacteroidales bacterium]
MKRRDFLRKGIAAGVIGSAAVSMFGYSKVLRGNPIGPQADGKEGFDLVAIRGNDPAAMFDKGIESLGGLKSFVKAGDKVVVKPNIGWDVIPERAANTNPQLVKRIVKRCYEAGAKEVFVFDNTCDNWVKCYKNSGIEDAAKSEGAKIVPGNTENYYQEVEIPQAKKLKTAKVHERILDSDVFINVPILKDHGSARLSIAMKNLMGVVWDRRFWHRNDLHQCIADYCTFPKKPDLNIVDAYRVMKRNGPRGVSADDVVRVDAMIISPDIVAVDAAATKFYGSEPSEIPYIAIAHEMGIGNMDLDKLKIDRVKL